MSYTADDLANLKRAIASGASETRIGGEMVKFRSLAEMRSIEADIEADLSATPSTGFTETIYES